MFMKFLSHLRQQYLGALALFLVLGGTSYAVATNSIGSREIKNNSIRSRDIRNNQVSSSDVTNGSLAAIDFRTGQLPGGDRGPQGIPGPTGPAGAKGETGAGGVAGPQGSKGDTGAPGATGATGAQGATGQTGAEGPPGISGLERVAATSASNSTGKSVTARCPAGKRVIGTGAGIGGSHRLSGDLSSFVADVVIDQIYPSPENVVPGYVSATAYEEEEVSLAWSVTAYALCANVS